MICNRKLSVSACVKGKVYKMVVRPAMLYGLETVPLTKKQEAELRFRYQCAHTKSKMNAQYTS